MCVQFSILRIVLWYLIDVEIFHFISLTANDVEHFFWGGGLFQISFTVVAKVLFSADQEATVYSTGAT